MVRAALLSCAAMLAVCALAQDQWWSNGDGHRRDGLSCERNTIISDARVYDDFDVPARAMVRGAWGNFLVNFVPARAYYEIRSGVSEGNGGTLHTSGEMDVEVAATGRVTQDHIEYLVRGQFPEPVMLEPGRYWVTVAPVGQGTGRCYISDTVAKDEQPDSDPTPPPMGAPHLNHNSFFDSTHFGYNFADTKRVMGSGSWDFAFGVGPNTGPPVHLRAETMRITYGKHVLGTVEDLYGRGGGYVEIQQQVYPNISAANAQLVIDATMPFDEFGYLCLNFATCVTAQPRDGVLQRVEFFDFESRAWTVIVEEAAGKYNCEIASACVTVDSWRFVDPLTRRVRAAISWYDRGSATLNWSALIDRAFWVTEQQ